MEVLGAPKGAHSPQTCSPPGCQPPSRCPLPGRWVLAGGSRAGTGPARRSWDLWCWGPSAPGTSPSRGQRGRGSGPCTGTAGAASTGGLRACKGVRPRPLRELHGSGHPNFPVHTPTSLCTTQFPHAHPTALRRAPYLGAGGEAERSGTVMGTQYSHRQRQLSRGSPVVLGPLPAPSASGDLGWCQAGAMAVTCPHRGWQGAPGGGHTPENVSPAPRGARDGCGCAKHPVSVRFGHGRAVLRAQPLGVSASMGNSRGRARPHWGLGHRPALPSAGSTSQAPRPDCKWALAKGSLRGVTSPGRLAASCRPWLSTDPRESSAGQLGAASPPPASCPTARPRWVPQLLVSVVAPGERGWGCERRPLVS